VIGDLYRLHGCAGCQWARTFARLGIVKWAVGASHPRTTLNIRENRGKGSGESPTKRATDPGGHGPVHDHSLASPQLSGLSFLNFPLPLFSVSFDPPSRLSPRERVGDEGGRGQASS
jgi:hypothetical protein